MRTLEPRDQDTSLLPEIGFRDANVSRVFFTREWLKSPNDGGVRRDAKFFSPCRLDSVADSKRVAKKQKDISARLVFLASMCLYLPGFCFCLISTGYFFLIFFVFRMQLENDGKALWRLACLSCLGKFQSIVKFFISKLSRYSETKTDGRGDGDVAKINKYT